MRLTSHLFIRINFVIHLLALSYINYLISVRKYSKALTIIENIAKLYAKNYIGLLASNKLENALKRIGDKTVGAEQNFIVQNKTDKEPLKILHLATNLYDYGGHTKLIESWIKYDYDNTHEIVLTDQKLKIGLDFSAPIHYLKNDNFITKGKALRKLVFENRYDKIIIMQHWHDIIPSIALWDFAEKDYGIETIFYVHSDFVFSLGSSIAKKRIDFTETTSDISIQYKPYVPKNYILKFPLEQKKKKKKKKPTDKKSTPSSQSIASTGINIVNFLAVASPYKFKPYRSNNFLLEWNNFLKSKKNIQLTVIGCDYKNFKQFCPGEIKTDNLILKGFQKDINPFYENADYILNPYPISTGLGVFNAIHYNVVPIASYCGVIVTEKAFISSLPEEFAKHMDFRTQKEYFDFLESELKSGKLKSKAKHIISKFFEKHSLENWHKQLNYIYNDKVVYKNSKRKLKDSQNLILTNESLNWYDYNNKKGHILLVKIIGLKLKFLLKKKS